MKAAQPQKAEEEEDEVVDAGAIDDPAGQERKKKKDFTLNAFILSVNFNVPLLLVIHLQRTVTTTLLMMTAKDDLQLF